MAAQLHQLEYTSFVHMEHLSHKLIKTAITHG